MSQRTVLRDGYDVIVFLTTQHDQIKALFELVATSHGAEREQAFMDLRRLLAVHETAEELVVHPRARQGLADGPDVVETRLREERQAKRALARLETMQLESAQFAAALAQLQTDVLAHAESEEAEEFTQLRVELDDDELAAIRRAVESAERLAPTRHQAGMESATANWIVGPFATMLDRARDALSSAAR